MKKGFAFYMAFLLMLFSQCNKKEVQTTEEPVIGKDQISKVIEDLKTSYGDNNLFRIERGVAQVAALWMKVDGTADDFAKFCMDYFIPDALDLKDLYNKLASNYEVLWGNFIKMGIELHEPLDIDLGNNREPAPIDLMFGSYNPASHLTEDLFTNKIAFINTLNFPFFTLDEKKEMGEKWTRLEWAYTRMGDLFLSRVPALLLQAASEASTKANAYISGYNIFMGKLVDDKGSTYFPADMQLISHWGLRDELKSNYTDSNGLFKQRMIYEVMKRIIDQSIPEEVINSDEFQWDPFTNAIFKEGKQVNANVEADIRYQYLLNNFKALKAMDPYNPHYPTLIQRKFDEEMEMSQAEVEKLFIDFVSSPQVKKLAVLISQRLGRNLEPFDIWYDGFKARSSMNETLLDEMTSKKYPDAASFEADMQNILKNLGFTPDKAVYIASKIRVEAARGSGGAWGAGMRSEKARLRTRITSNGMNYKGYNIAIHEFGHNVEQTITLHDLDYYMLNGVPNTAFTEALAFIFQKRDLELLGIKENNPGKYHLMALDDFWACYEIMGVSLVDMNVWKWLYEHPDATAAELKEAVIIIAKDVWNKYYADVFGSKDETILAIYSHMISYPLYLSAYPLGHIIDFQIEKYITDKNFAVEIGRIYKKGRLIPQLWMKSAVGEGISITPLLEATDKAVTVVNSRHGIGIE